ncbi:hypothetical protein [Gemmatimonas sp.]|uniref:hypothetical protein n=1 Tax=Gemmatimonas sp. TaxID=1962908 RepID=UPI00286C98DD|nr:hypothetical protein [Gemmatimonas sp.]
MRYSFLATAAALVSVGAITMTACRDDAPTAVRAADAPSVAFVRASSRAGSSAAPVQLPPSGFASEVLSRGRFEDDLNVQFRIKDGHATEVAHVTDPSDMVLARVTIKPNSSIPWHTHPGPAMVTVTSGTLVFVGGETCEARTYSAADPSQPKPSFVDRGQGHVHAAYNPGNTPTILTVTYLGVTGPSALILATNPGC